MRLAILSSRLDPDFSTTHHELPVDKLGVPDRRGSPGDLRSFVWVFPDIIPIT